MSQSGMITLKRRLKTELFSRSFPDLCDCVNFRYICKVASQLWLMKAKSNSSIIMIIIIIVISVDMWTKPCRQVDAAAALTA